jgi:hypothetical protein
MDGRDGEGVEDWGGATKLRFLEGVSRVGTGNLLIMA